MQDSSARIFLSPAEVAAELRVSTSTVLRLIRSGRLPAIAVSERIYRIPVATLERFLNGDLDRHFPVAITEHEGPAPSLGAGETLPMRRRSVACRRP
jgi:excisionase family DNA binding protein